jgi:hypothetical protein
MPKTYYNYQVYCTTEAAYVNDGSYRLTPPTTCPNDPLHTINPTATIPVGSFTENEVIIRESTTPNGGNFMAASLIINAPANSTGDYLVGDKPFPFPIVALTSYANTGTEHIGDVLSLSVRPKKPIGMLSQPIAPAPLWVSQNYLEGDRVVYNGELYTCIADTTANQEPLLNEDIQSSWWAYGYRVPISTFPQIYALLYVGYTIRVTDGINTDDLGRILTIDSTNNYLYMESNPINSFAAGSALKLIIYSIRDYVIGSPGRNVIGQGKMGGKGIPARTPIIVTYTNNSGTSKVFSGGFEFLY